MADLSPAAARKLANLIGLFELAAATGGVLSEDEARVILNAQQAAHDTDRPENPGTDEESGDHG
ncbi:hypothetical protein [Actinomadura rubrisoli]|uniref:Uncharacterized protein n=1 Tax=Actinomadura rubrisoli TaxID=2530368 RepID=A0A4V2YZM3_9ACTN|nr:hypothetical protein [Actinomadura rubrisoli]TDD97717.1 hypothetical protein E1298_01385 [Actinomadura rubrisoli]